jgi:hypothetical protein
MEMLAIVSKKTYLLKEPVRSLGCNRIFGCFLGVLYPDKCKQNTQVSGKGAEKMYVVCQKTFSHRSGKVIKSSLGS